MAPRPARTVMAAGEGGEEIRGEQDVPQGNSYSLYWLGGGGGGEESLCASPTASTERGGIGHATAPASGSPEWEGREERGLQTLKLQWKDST